MKRILFIALTMLLVSTVYAQQPERIVVKEGDTLTDKLYQFPEFKQGVVMLKNDNPVQVKLNYNCLTKQIQMMGEDDTVLDIAEPEGIMQILLNDKSYVYTRNGYMEYVDQIGDVVLYLQMGVRVVDKTSQGAYGTTSSLSSNHLTSVMTNNPSFWASKDAQVLAGQQLILEKEDKCFITKNNKNMSANIKNISNLFPKHKDEIANYIKENDLNLDSVDVMKSLLSYIVSNYSSAK